MVRKLSRRSFMFGCASGGLAAGVAACSFGQAGMTPYGVAVSGEGNSLTLQQLNPASSGYLATVQSARGIGQAAVTWWGIAYPRQLTFALELAGLEQFSLQWADQTVNLSVNARDQSVYASGRDAAGGEAAISPVSPYWMEVRATPADAPGFIISAPQAFLATWPPVWGITWIDYYR